MNDTLKKMLSYYKPHRKTFIIDMIFAFLSAAVTLVIPIIIRYVTSTVIHQDGPEMFETMVWLSVLMLVLVGFYC